ncbi:uncharacterized protein LOC107617307 isoform X1 [Arachis ipaensis]|uniref:uncharacterized protein LOC107617307 isoform X1 n=1 Tax=Arachis ipaensis TaxID=130454 RepID=UPI000A2B0A21|nr:uncharacterized protein LOC107617307 isoform X1 [Arachis ipaensis]XP_029151811.1 uncharacterized protein LOC112777642 isoform X4 [Arachis hypogaea]
MTDSKAYLPFILFVFLHLCSHALTRQLSEDSTSGEADYYKKERTMVYPMQIKPVEPVQPIPPMDPYPTPPQRPYPEPEQDFLSRRHNNIHTTNYLIGYYQPFITSPMSSTKTDHHTHSKVHQPLSLEDIDNAKVSELLEDSTNNQIDYHPSYYQQDRTMRYQNLPSVAKRKYPKNPHTNP